MLETWVLFFMLITSPGQYKVEVLETFTTQQACRSMASTIDLEFKSVYAAENIKDTFSFVCLKQKEKQA